MLARASVATRNQHLNLSPQLGNQIRGVVKTPGFIVPKGTGRVFDAHIGELLEGQTSMAHILLPLFDAWLDNCSVRPFVTANSLQRRGKVRLQRC